ncbi:MAG: hypothetical protein U9Q98_10840, partial [Bacteroidota bacterium]|nr:hypothetical protein [Bacteroidota bacterium]
NWIEELSQNNSDTTIDWSDKKEILCKIESFPSVEKLNSMHQRTLKKDSIILWHYLIDLISKN